MEDPRPMGNLGACLLLGTVPGWGLAAVAVPADGIRQPPTLEEDHMNSNDRYPDLERELNENGHYVWMVVDVIRKHLGNMRIDEITTRTVKSLDTELLKEGYVAETVARIHNSLKRHLADAGEAGYIPQTPYTRSARPPRVERKEKNAIDDKTRKRLLSLLDLMGDSQFTLAVRLGLGAGLRNEEAVGLHWEDVDLDRGYLHIRRALTNAGGKNTEKEPKTRAGRRAGSWRGSSWTRTCAPPGRTGRARSSRTSPASGRRRCALPSPPSTSS